MTDLAARPHGRLAGARQALTPREWARAGAMAATIIGLNVLGWGMLAAEQEYRLGGGFWTFMGNFDINKAGFVVVGVFVLTWAAALAVWHFGKIEQKWAAAGEGPQD